MDVDALAKPMPMLGSLSKCDAGKSKSSHFHVLAVYSIISFLNVALPSFEQVICADLISERT